MKITVAIPSYNGLEQLQRLLPTLAAQGFSQIVVLDDASTDGTAEWVRQQPGIELIAGETNLGPTGNRNRMLGRVTGDITVFLDADMELLSDNAAAAVSAVFEAHPTAAVMAPLILSQTDEPMWYNWGYEFSPQHDGFTAALNAVALAHWGNAEVTATVRQLAAGQVGHFESVEPREVEWVVEQCFAVRTRVFAELGGFDEAFRMFHEGPDYCKRARAAGHTVRFEPAIRAKHLDMRTGTTEQRTADMRASTKYWYQKHYQVPDAVIERFFLS